eukprot:gene9888-16851_t
MAGVTGKARAAPRGGHYCHIFGSNWEENEEEKSMILPFMGPVNKWMRRAAALVSTPK